MMNSIQRHFAVSGAVYRCYDLNSGYIWNKTEIKQFCFSFISDVVTCEIKQKQNTETVLKRFSIVLELFQAH